MEQFKILIAEVQKQTALLQQIVGLLERPAAVAATGTTITGTTIRPLIVFDDFDILDEEETDGEASQEKAI